MPRVKTCLLIAVAVFIVLVPWFEELNFYADKIMVDGVTTSAITVLTIAIGFSLVSWPALSAASKRRQAAGNCTGGNHRGSRDSPVCADSRGCTAKRYKTSMISALRGHALILTQSFACTLCECTTSSRTTDCRRVPS